MKVLDLRFKLPEDQEKCTLFNEEEGPVQVTLLQKAAIFGLTEYVRLLSKCPSLSWESVTPFLLAGYYGHFDLVQYFIEQEVISIVKKSKNTFSPLLPEKITNKRS